MSDINLAELAHLEAELERLRELHRQAIDEASVCDFRAKQHRERARSLYDGMQAVQTRIDEWKRGVGRRWS